MKRLLMVISFSALGVLFAGPVLHAAGLASAEPDRAPIAQDQSGSAHCPGFPAQHSSVRYEMSSRIIGRLAR